MVSSRWREKLENGFLRTRLILMEGAMGSFSIWRC